MDDIKYKYKTPEFCDESIYDFESPWDVEYIKHAAEHAAEDFFKNRDGWDVNWPIVFEIYSMNDKLLGTFEIELRQEPVFGVSTVA